VQSVLAVAEEMIRQHPIVGSTDKYSLESVASFLVVQG
jgi:hypothetical protein